MKYDKIVAINKEKSRQKAQIAIKQIQTMLENQEQITVEALRKRTGFAKSFFTEIRKYEGHWIMLEVNSRCHVIVWK